MLSGGNIKGAYQAGAVSALLQAGYSPGIVTGISVGALNGGFLAGSTPAGSTADWPAIGRRLEEFWRTQVRRPGDFVRRRNFLTIAWNALRRRWNGLVDTDPLARIVRRELAAADPRKTWLKLRVGAVNIRTGDLVYVDGSEPRLVDYILASTAEPVGMPLRVVGAEPFYDGGVRDYAPLKQAIDLGAGRIVAVICRPERVSPVGPDFNLGDALDLVSRVVDIVTNEIVQNDLEWFLEVNRYVRQGLDHPLLAGKRFIPILVIRPAEPLRLSLDDFTPADIDRLIEQGRADAVRAAEAARADPADDGHEIANSLRR